MPLSSQPGRAEASAVWVWLEERKEVWAAPTHILQAAANSCRTSLCKTRCQFRTHSALLAKTHFQLFVDTTTTAVWSTIKQTSPTHSFLPGEARTKQWADPRRHPWMPTGRRQRKWTQNAACKNQATYTACLHVVWNINFPSNQTISIPICKNSQTYYFSKIYANALHLIQTTNNWVFQGCTITVFNLLTHGNFSGIFHEYQKLKL